MKKRIISILLVMLMLFAIIPPAMAIELEPAFEPIAIEPFAVTSSTFRVYGFRNIGRVGAFESILRADRASDWKQLTSHGVTFFNTTQATVTISRTWRNTTDIIGRVATTASQQVGRPGNLTVWG